MICHKVQRNRFELSAAAALHKQNVVVLRNVHKFPYKRKTFGVNPVVKLAAVAHFHNAHAAAAKIQKLGFYLLQNFHRQYARACGVVKTSHNDLLKICLLNYTTNFAEFQIIWPYKTYRKQ